MKLRPGQQSIIRQRLMAQCRQLEAELAHFDAWQLLHLGFGKALIDDASTAFDQATQTILRTNTEQRLAQVKQALSKLEKGCYGSCEGCGENIRNERLLAIPYARLCIACQRVEEKSPLGCLFTPDTDIARVQPAL